MKNKAFILVITLYIVSICVACGINAKKDDVESSTQKKSTESEVADENDDTNNDVSYSKSFMFMGYHIFYADDYDMSTTDYGKVVGNTKCLAIIEAPSEAGIVFDINNVKDVPNVCQEYLFNTLEGRFRSKFQFDKTEQIMKTVEIVSINGIEMLRVRGNFNNLEDDNSVPYVGYYFLGGPENNRPLYVVGIPMDETAEVEAFMDEFAKQIKKN